MKKILFCLILVVCFSICSNQLKSESSTQINGGAKIQPEVSEILCEETSCFNREVVDLAPTAKSAYICDEKGNIEVFAKNPDERLTIASMTKIMLLNLVFQAIEDGTLTENENVCVTERANSMGGSQVFLQANREYPAKDLIKSVIVASANDASVALAERLYGTEETCVQKMNVLANEWGLCDTLFSNVTGLPKPTQYSSAKDVAVMLSKLIKFDKYFDYSSIYLDELIHPDGQKTTLTNTNKLVRFYDGCDGGKTGYTSESKYCIATTAKKGDMRVIAVVIGEPSSKERFRDVKEMFDYTFNTYQNKRVVDSTAILSDSVKVEKGNKKQISVGAKENFDYFCRKGETVDLTYELKVDKNLKAPINKGQTVGEIVIYNGGVETCKTELISLDSVSKKTIFDSFEEIFGNWKL